METRGTKCQGIFKESTSYAVTRQEGTASSWTYKGIWSEFDGGAAPEIHSVLIFKYHAYLKQTAEASRYLLWQKALTQFVRSKSPFSDLLRIWWQR